MRASCAASWQAVAVLGLNSLPASWTSAAVSVAACSSTCNWKAITSFAWGSLLCWSGVVEGWAALLLCFCNTSSHVSTACSLTAKATSCAIDCLHTNTFLMVHKCLVRVATTTFLATRNEAKAATWCGSSSSLVDSWCLGTPLSCGVGRQSCKNTQHNNQAVCMTSGRLGKFTPSASLKPSLNLHPP